MPIKSDMVPLIKWMLSEQQDVSLDYNPAEVDQHKLNLIDYEFCMSFFENVLDVTHLCKLLYIRGWSLCLFDIAFIGKSAFYSVQRMIVDTINFFEYKVFVACINKSLETKQFREHDQEICPICQEYMVKGIKLRCSHIYHQFCIVQFI